MPGWVKSERTAENAIPRSTPGALAWLDQNWPFAGTVAAVFLISLLPLLVGVWPTTLVLVYAQLIIYKLHDVLYGAYVRLYSSLKDEFVIQSQFESH